MHKWVKLACLDILTVNMLKIQLAAYKSYKLFKYMYLELINFYLHSCIFLDSDWWRNLFHYTMKKKIKLHNFL